MLVFANIFFKFLIFYPHFPTFYQQNIPPAQNHARGNLVGMGVWDRVKNLSPDGKTFLIEARWR